MQEARLAIRLNPESDLAHFSLGNSLRLQKDWAGRGGGVSRGDTAESELRHDP